MTFEIKHYSRIISFSCRRSGSIAFADVDNDGALDIFLTYPLKDKSSRASLYLNAGDFRFDRHPIAGHSFPSSSVRP